MVTNATRQANQNPHWGETFLDLDVCGRTIDRMVSVLSQAGDKHRAINRLIGDLAIARQSVDEAKQAMGGRR